MATPIGQVRSSGPASPSHRLLFGPSSLMAPAAAASGDRVVAEVWSDGAVQIGFRGSASVRRTLAVLEGDHVVHPASAELPAAPVLGQSAGAGTTSQFIGRVIVEFPPGGAAVMVAGADGARIVDATILRLRQLAKSGSPIQ